MGITVGLVREVALDSTGVQEFLCSDLGGLTPLAARFFITKAIGDGDSVSDAVAGVGVCTASSEWSVGWFAQDAQGNMNTGRRGMSDKCIHLLTDTGTVDCEADFDSFVTNGVRIDWTNVSADRYIIFVELWAGDDLSAAAGIFTAAAAMGNTTDVNTVGFEPDVVLLGSPCTTFNDTTYATDVVSFGLALNQSPVWQGCWAIYSEDAAAAANVRAIISETYGIGQVGAAANWAWAGEIGSFDANGFSCTTRQGASGGDQVGYLAVAFNGSLAFWADIIDTPTATGNDAQAAPGLRPQYVTLGQTHLTAIDAVDATGNAGSVGFGCFIENYEYSCSVQDEDAQGTSDTKSMSDDMAANLPLDSGALGHRAFFTSFDASGWTLYYENTLGAARKWWALAIGEPYSYVPGSPTVTGPLTWSPAILPSYQSG